jgi:hypothetical protein
LDAVAGSYIENLLKSAKVWCFLFTYIVI